VRDNGKGFDPNAKQTGIGISNMASRTEALNGTFQLISRPGAGCSLSVSFPDVA